MPNFRERTRLRRARIAAGSSKELSVEPRARPIVPQPPFDRWPVNLPSPPVVEEAEQTLAEKAAELFEPMTYRELQTFLKANKLSAAGTKADLLTRAIEFTEEESMEGEPIE